MVVTGAGHGIGRAVALRLAEERCLLVLADIDRKAVDTLAAALGDRHMAAPLDVTCAAAVQDLARDVRDRFGRLDVWINNAGLLPQGLLMEQGLSVLEATWEVNVAGVLHGCRAALGVMLPQRSGHIVNIASVCALRPLPGLALYSATKAAVRALSHALRREVSGHGIGVSAVLPHLTTTRASAGLRRPRMFPALRPAQVADAVAAVLHRPCAQRVVPRRLGWLLAGAEMCPERVRDTAEAWLGADRTSLGADRAARTSYEAELPGGAHHD
ncbi:SDR family NAD(P)-dependent oxidoreductase [Streptomyces luteireticuli]|uniref:SDR family NAD(P)-dependent oxidoreductase n=1 Tax=Streptomyces luteireticuli TaxID=173858 RepID=UPI0031DBB590